jgi:cytosine/adenosine deaminase-related metal-dependent hydrolase
LIGPDLKAVTLEVARGKVVERGPAPLAGMSCVEVVDCVDATIQHGRVDALTHGWRALAVQRGTQNRQATLDRSDRTPEDWCKLACAHDHRSLTASARLFVAQSLLAGTTTIVDLLECPSVVEESLDILADACHEIGLRGVLGYTVTERQGGPEEAQRGLYECLRFLLCNNRPFVRGAVGIDDTRYLSDASIRAAVALARDQGAPLLVRVGLDQAEAQVTQRIGYASAFDRLEANGALGPGTVLTPGTFLTEEQVRRAEALGVWIVQTPRASLSDGSGYGLALGESHRVALGSGGLPSDLRAEAAALSQLARQHGDDHIQAGRRALGGRELAAELLGLDLSLAPGGAADLVVGGGNSVRHVVVGGRHVVRDGELLTARLDDLIAEGDDHARRLRVRLRAA